MPGVFANRLAFGCIHALRHGSPLNQIDERFAREQADAGVRVALWADGMDQFFKGVTDGVLKRWNILLSPEDALVENKMHFTEERCFLGGLGDSGGGFHVLEADHFHHQIQVTTM